MNKYAYAFMMLVIIAAMTACGGSKGTVVVAVDMERVIAESKQAKEIIAEVDEFAKSAETQIREAAGQIEAAAADPKSDPAKVNAMKAQFNEMVRRAEEQVNIGREEAEARLRKTLEETLDGLAKEKGWGMVVPKRGQSVLWTGGALDQTDLVIKKLDEKAPAAKKKP